MGGRINDLPIKHILHNAHYHHSYIYLKYGSLRFDKNWTWSV